MAKKTAILMSMMAGGVSEVTPTSNPETDAFLAELNSQEAGPTTEIIETNDAPIAPEVLIEAANPEAPAAPEVVELTAEQKKAEKKAAREAAKAQKAEAAAKAKAEREQKKAAAKAEREAKKAEPKPEKPKRVFFADKADRIVHRLGDSLGDYMVLELGDAALTGDELKAKQDETMATIRGMNLKVKNRANLMLEFVSGKSNKLNNVIACAFKLLKADGKLTTGDKGNFITALQVKGDHNPRPYSILSARAQGNNTVSLMKQMKVIVADGDQTYKANPQSLYLAKVNGMLGI